MPTYRVDELEGALLDATVARMLGYLPRIEGDEVWLYPRESTMPPSWQEGWPNTRAAQRVVCQQFHPSRDRYEGAALMEREGISVAKFDRDPEGMRWGAAYVDGSVYFTSREYYSRGPTPWVAVARAFLKRRLEADTVDLP